MQIMDEIEENIQLFLTCINYTIKNLRCDHFPFPEPNDEYNFLLETSCPLLRFHSITKSISTKAY